MSLSSWRMGRWRKLWATVRVYRTKLFAVFNNTNIYFTLISGVVIEYINAAHDGVTLGNGMVLDNIMKVENSAEIDNQAVMDMDVDDIIIEESVGNDLPGSGMASSSFETETTVQSRLPYFLERFPMD